MKTPVSTLCFILLISLGQQALAWQAESSPKTPKIETELSVQTEELQPPQEGEIQEPEPGELQAIEVPAVGGMHEQILSMQKEALNKEFQWLEKELDLSTEAIERSKEAFKETLEKTVKKRVERMQQDGMFSYPNSLLPELREQLASQILKELPVDQHRKLRELIVDQQMLAASWDRISQESVASYLDSSLCFSSEQEKQVADLLAQNWDNTWNSMAASLHLNGLSIGKQMVSSMDESKLKEILTEEQYLVFQDLQKMTVGNLFMFAGPPGMGDKEDKLEIKEICNTLMDLKIAEYMELCQLDPKQLKVLSVARKGAIAKVASRYDEQIAKLQENPNGIGLNNMRSMIEFSKPILGKCTAESAWQKTLRKILKEDQLKKIEDRELERVQAIREQSCQFMAHAFVAEQLQLKLSFERHEKLVELIRKQCEKEGTQDLYSCLFSMFNVSDEDFQTIFTKDEWNQFSPMFEEQRQQMRQVMGEPNNDEDTSDEEG